MESAFLAGILRRFWPLPGGPAAWLVLILALGCTTPPQPAAPTEPAPSRFPRAYGVIVGVDVEAREEAFSDEPTRTWRARPRVRVRYQVGPQVHLGEAWLAWQEGFRGTRDGARLHVAGGWPLGLVVQVPYDPANPAMLKGLPEPLPYRIRRDQIELVDMSRPLDTWIRQVGEPTAGYPDLVAPDVTDPPQARAGETVTLRVRMRNTGTSVAGNPRMVVREGGKVLAERTFRGGLHPGQELSWLLQWTPGRPGPTVLEWQVNPDEAVWESTYANNVGRVEVEVGAGAASGASRATLKLETVERLPDLRPAELKVRPRARVGEPAWVEFTLRNEGLVHSGGSVLTLSVDGKEVGRVTSTGVVQPRASWPERIRWTPQASGRHTLRVVADPANAIAEIDDGNNAVEAVVEVAP